MKTNEPFQMFDYINKKIKKREINYKLYNLHEFLLFKIEKIDIS